MRLLSALGVLTVSVCFTANQNCRIIQVHAAAAQASLDDTLEELVQESIEEIIEEAIEEAIEGNFDGGDDTNTDDNFLKPVGTPTHVRGSINFEGYEPPFLDPHSTYCVEMWDVHIEGEILPSRKLDSFMARADEIYNAGSDLGFSLTIPSGQQSLIKYGVLLYAMVFVGRHPTCDKKYLMEGDYYSDSPDLVALHSDRHNYETIVEVIPFGM